MRDIKFRAWFGDEFEYFEAGDGQSFSGCDLSQYTGLSDKNGQEIYEGDILEYVDSPLPDHPKGEIRYIVGAVRYGQFSIGTGCEGHGMGNGKASIMGFYVERDYCNRAEIVRCNEHVVGNIYENPELLEEN